MAKTKKINVAVVEPFEMMRRGYKVILEDAKDLKITILASNNEGLVISMREKKPHIALISFWNNNNIATTRQLTSKFPDVKFIVIHEWYLSCLELQFIKEGAYQSVSSARQLDLIKIIREAHKTEKYIPRRSETLSSDEIRVLKLLCNFKTKTQMAKTLKTDVATVDRHEKNIYRKTEAESFVYLFNIGICLGVV